MADFLPVGTRIRFLKDLTEAPDEDRPWIQYAAKGELGTIAGHGTSEGYWAKADSWDKPFGLAPGEFEVVQPERRRESDG